MNPVNFVDDLENNCPKFYQPPLALENDLIVNNNECQFQSFRRSPLTLSSSLRRSTVNDNDDYEDDDDILRNSVEFGALEVEDDDSTNTNGSNTYSEKEYITSGSDSDPEEEEEEEDFDSDASNTDELLIDMERKFQLMLEKKVEDVEAVYDQRILSRTLQNAKKRHIETQTISTGRGDLPLKMVNNKKITTTGKLREQESKHVSTQTDDVSASLLLASVNTSREEPDCARLEIGRLRDAKMELISERKTLSDRIKKSVPEKLIKLEEKQLLEYEEGIEAIDTAIEFKNEIICGHPCILSNDMAPGDDKAGLVTRLASLSVFDLQRLLCKYFTKVVELRFSSRDLEKTLEKLEEDRDKIRRRMTDDQKCMRNMDTHYAERIKQLLSLMGQKDSALLLKMEEDLATAERRKMDYKRSLTELLVRHGYLLNGHDYDVKQVVRMLGIDAAIQFHADRKQGLNKNDSINHRRHKDRDRGGDKRRGIGIGSGAGQIAPQLEMGAMGVGMSTRRTIGQRRNAQTLITPPSIQQYQYGIGPGLEERAEKASSSRRSHHRDHRYNGGSGGGGTTGGGIGLRDTDEQLSHRHHRSHHQSNSNKGTEVTKEKHKLILQTQPNSSH